MVIAVASEVIGSVFIAIGSKVRQDVFSVVELLLDVVTVIEGEFSSFCGLKSDEITVVGLERANLVEKESVVIVVVDEEVGIVAVFEELLGFFDAEKSVNGVVEVGVEESEEATELDGVDKEDTAEGTLEECEF